MLLATQYYRPPFPESRYWKDDLAHMVDAGLNGVQLWVVWAWVEAEPGRFDFSDYDTLFAEAERVGLKVVLSTKAELQPLWMPRVLPDSAMVDHMGRRVVSTNRCESNFGLTPGGCTDHPAVRERMGRFLGETAAHYANASGLYGWDAWNELRWNVQSDGYVCYCPHTLAAFRQWLDWRYGGLAGLNAAWKRRYVAWEDVFPGKLPDRPFSETVDFCRFLAWRAADHARFRFEAIRAHDRMRPVTAHAGAPSWGDGGGGWNQAQHRGNDSDTAVPLDGFGCSHFPFWGGKIEDAEFGVRIQSTRSAARGKIMWVSELQGGSACCNFHVLPPVDATSQQRWVWNGVAHGAKATIFWCWRDEVFGRESSGFGIIGNDGHRDERIAAMRETGRALSRHADLLADYQPDVPRVGVYVENTDHMIEFALKGRAPLVTTSIRAYATALARLDLPFEIVDAGHLDVLDDLRVLILPFPLVVRPKAAERLAAFVRRGGTILAESELDSFTMPGFYRYPGEDRTFAAGLGVMEQGRRPIELPELNVSLDGATFALKPSEWLTPYDCDAADALCRGAAGQAVVLGRAVGEGRVVAVGSLLGPAYAQERYADFERFLAHLARGAGVERPLAVDSESPIHCKTGLADGGAARLVFLLNPGAEQRVAIRSGSVSIAPCAAARELLSDTYVEKADDAFAVIVPEKGVAVLRL